MTAAGDVALLVVRLSDSFGDFWPALARELDVPLTEWTPGPDAPPPPRAGVVLVAAGGHETEVGSVLLLLGMPADIPVVAVGASTSHRVAAQAVAAGASDYFALPDDRDGLRDALAVAVQRRRAAIGRAALSLLEAQAHAFREIVGESPALRAVLERAARVVPHAEATVLLTGETGTGKELLARALHYGGPRAAAPFVELNCAALPAPLLESELFGHERGAFTGADRQKRGLFETADGGTVFLDEIGEMAPPLQAKLLRFLEEKTFKRLGGVVDLHVDVRIIAATNRHLEEEVKKGRFRDDLYYRLNVLPILLPPLRARTEDIPALAHYFVDAYNSEFRKRVRQVTDEAMRTLQIYGWPGNVRELRNAVERAMLLVEGDELTVDLFPVAAARRSSLSEGIELPANGINLEQLERSLTLQALERTGWNQTRAATLLGLNRDQIRYRLEKFKLERPEPAS